VLSDWIILYTAEDSNEKDPVTVEIVEPEPETTDGDQNDEQNDNRNGGYLGPGLSRARMGGSRWLKSAPRWCSNIEARGQVPVARARRLAVRAHIEDIVGMTRFSLRLIIIMNSNKLRH